MGYSAALLCVALSFNLFTPSTQEELTPQNSKQWLGSWSVKVDRSISRQQLEQMAQKHGLEVIGDVSALNDTYFLHPLTKECGDHREHCRSSRSIHIDGKLLNELGVVEVNQQHEISRVRHRSTGEVTNKADAEQMDRSRRWATPRDPLFGNQWYYSNSKYKDHDHNVIPAWVSGYTGKGVVVCVVDDGIEHDHDDLKRNYDARASWDYNSNDNDAYPREEDPINNHGTRCCGVVAAEFNNDACGAGAAYNANVGGIRMLDGPVSDVVEANSLGHNLDHIDIYSSSWGPNDDGRTIEAPGPLAQAVFKKGVTEGRGGKGAIYLFASGNGGSRDDCNCDGYANSLYTMAVSAIGEQDSSPYYSENCAAAMTTAYSSGGGRAITTVDLHNRCTSSFSGTSAASPLAAGILALVLEARPELTWRDIQHVVAHSSAHVNPSDGSWTKTSAGLWHSHKFGFGRLDANAAVELAKTWQLVGDQVSTTLTKQNGGRGTFETYTQNVDSSQTAITKLEHVQVKVNAQGGSSARGKLQFKFYCPDGTASLIMSSRSSDRSTALPLDWIFMTVRCWDQSPIGEWKLEMISVENSATLEDWTLILHGTGGSSPPITTGATVDSTSQQQHDNVATSKTQSTHTTTRRLSTTTDISNANNSSNSTTDASSESTIKPAYFVLLIIPVGLLVIGVGIWLHKRSRHDWSKGGYITAPESFSIDPTAIPTNTINFHTDDGVVADNTTIVTSFGDCYNDDE
eukprot:m.215219 g.215219  ORF g.215219 m.215219 type:complete len:743 (+) comp33186_c2_seq5:259-2487(+)